MKFEITKQFTFEACHCLPHLPEGHKCRNMHGHSYGLTVGVSGELDSNLWVQDYADIAAAVDPIIEALDHRNLNEVMGVVTTAEQLAMWVAMKLKPRLPLLSRIEIQETPTSNVILRLNQ